MSLPFPSYSKLANELLELAAEDRFAGELVDLIGLKEDEELDGWFDDAASPEAPKRRGRLLRALVRAMEVYRVRNLEPPVDQSAIVHGRFQYAFADDASKPAFQ